MLNELLLTALRFAVVIVILSAPATLRAGPSGLAVLQQQVLQLFLARRYTEAEPIARELVARATRTFGPDRPNTATALNALARIYHEQARYSEAEPLYQRALKIRLATLRPDSAPVGESLNNLAGLNYAQGRYSEAGPLF